MAFRLTYRPLNQDPPEIRLLELQPGAEGARSLEGTLRHSALSSARYSCLSYVWGDPNTDEKSEIGIAYKRTLREHFHFQPKRGRGSEWSKFQMKIGSSLAAALRRLRHKRNRITIWVDALCINQEDTEEKDWQVPLMMQIYSNATSVHAWLGPSPRDDERPDVVGAATAAFDLIPIVAGLLRRFDCMQRLRDETSWSKACFALAEPRTQDERTPDDQRFWAAMSRRLRDAMVSEGLWDGYLSAFNTLSQMKYFQRMWVLQETGRARILTFYYSERQAAYKLLFLSLCLARPFCTSKSPAGVRAVSPGFDSRFLSCLTARMYCNLDCDITKVLELAYWQRPPMHQATNPRDLIYALLGLVSGPTEITVRYNLSVEYAYISATRLLLSQGFTDILLSFKPYTSSEAVTTTNTFPSWAYDWSTREISSFGQHVACGQTQPALSFIELPAAGCNVAMTIKGSRCGYVTATSSPFSAVASTAGLTPQVIQAGNINLQPFSAGEEQKQTFSEQIRWEYCQLHIDVPIADAEKFLNDSVASIAPFWIWWIKWVTALWSFASANLRQEDDPKVLNGALELLFRKASTDLKSLAAARSLLDLIDLHFWPNTRLGVEAVQMLFRSAWGMRPLALDGRHLSYGPESTRPGDEIVIFYGVKAPLVVRKVDETACKIIGPAHVCGVMQGQFMDTSRPGQEALYGSVSTRYPPAIRPQLFSSRVGLNKLERVRPAEEFGHEAVEYPSENRCRDDVIVGKFKKVAMFQTTGLRKGHTSYSDNTPTL